MVTCGAALTTERKRTLYEWHDLTDEALSDVVRKHHVPDGASEAVAARIVAEYLRVTGAWTRTARGGCAT